MNMKLLGAFAVALLLVLGIPLLGGMISAGGAPTPAQAFVPPSSAGGKTSAPGASPSVASAADATPVIPTVVESPPMLDEVSLIGTAWQVSHKMGTIEVSLMGNGVAQAHHMLLGNIQGSWHVEGADVVITATVMNKTETIRVAIRGTALYANGVAIQRLR